MNEQQRSEFRAFVRAHHPDRGGDPEVFVAGLARFGVEPGPDTGSGSGAGSDTGGGDAADGRRSDTPVEVVGRHPFPVRVGVALIRTWHRHRRSRVR